MYNHSVGQGSIKTKKIKHALFIQGLGKLEAKVSDVLFYSSPLGMYSLLRSPRIISVLKDNGDLDTDNLNTIITNISSFGGNGLRDFFWIDSQNAFDIISPFKGNKSSDPEFNQKFFDIYAEIAQACKAKNLRFCYDLFDNCGTKNDPANFNPWFKAGFSDYFYGAESKAWRTQYIDKVLTAFKGLDNVELGVCNEPNVYNYDNCSTFLADTYVQLINGGVAKENISIGADVVNVVKNNDFYNNYVSQVVTELGDPSWETYMKSNSITPCHNTTQDYLTNTIWGGQDPKPGGGRRIMYSEDGVKTSGEVGQDRTRPNIEEMQELATFILSKKSTAAQEGRVNFEVVYGKDTANPIDSIIGVINAWNDFQPPETSQQLDNSVAM